MINQKMTSLERQAISSLAAIMGLRMIGLFMIIPIFSIYAMQLPGSTATLVGLAMGIYGLSQALFQIPFGTLSDRLGRKPIIIFGLSLFIIGSMVAGFAQNIAWMIVGRSLQGVGAVGGTILATLSDLTREEQRTKAMAIAGITIGLSFSLAMFLGPIFSEFMPINKIFFISAAFGALAIFLLLTTVPTPTHVAPRQNSESGLRAFLQLLRTPELAKLNSGIFILHAIFTASFIVIPICLLHTAKLEANRQWLIYLPTLLIAFIAALVLIGQAERKQQLRFYFLLGISMIAGSEILLWLASLHIAFACAGLCFFFAGFSLLEAFLPSLVSRTAPPERKGSALGLFSCAQFLGIFVGGMLGGWIYGHYQFLGVYIFCITLALLWFVLAFYMQVPRTSRHHAMQHTNIIYQKE